MSGKLLALYLCLFLSATYAQRLVATDLTSTYTGWVYKSNLNNAVSATMTCAGNTILYPQVSGIQKTYALGTLPTGYQYLQIQMVIYAIDLYSVANPTIDIAAGPSGNVGPAETLPFGRLSYTLIRGSCGNQQYSDYYTKVTYYVDYTSVFTGNIEIHITPAATTTTTFGVNSITFTMVSDVSILPAYLDFGSSGAQYGWTQQAGGLISGNACSGTSYLKLTTTSSAKKTYNAFYSYKLYQGLALTYTVFGNSLDSTSSYTIAFSGSPTVNFQKNNAVSLQLASGSDWSTLKNPICTGATTGKNYTHVLKPQTLTQTDGLIKVIATITQAGTANAFYTFSNIQFYGLTTATEPSTYPSSYADTVTTGWRTNEAGQTTNQQLTTASGTKYIRIYGGNSVANTYFYKSASGKVNITFDLIFVATTSIKNPGFAFFLNDVLQSNWTSSSGFKAGSPSTEFTMTYTSTIYIAVGDTPLTFRFQDLGSGISAGVKNIRISDVVVKPVAVAPKVQPKKTNTGVVAGAAIGAIVGVIIIIVVVYFVWKWYQGRNKTTIVVKDEENYNAGGGGGGEFTYGNNTAPAQPQTQPQPQPQPQPDPYGQPNGLIMNQQQQPMYQQQPMQPVYVDPNAQYGYQQQPMYQPQPGPTTVTINVKV